MPRKFEAGNTKPVRMDKAVYAKLTAIAEVRHETVKYLLEYIVRQYMRTQEGGDLVDARADRGLWIRLEKKVDDKIEWAGPFETVVEARDALRVTWSARRDLYGATLCFGRESEAVTVKLHFERYAADSTMRRVQKRATALEGRAKKC